MLVNTGLRPNVFVKVHGSLNQTTLLPASKKKLIIGTEIHGDGQIMIWVTNNQFNYTITQSASHV